MEFVPNFGRQRWNDDVTVLTTAGRQDKASAEMFSLPGFVDDREIVPHQSTEEELLLRRLNGLRQQILEALVVCADFKLVPKQVMSPFPDDIGNIPELSCVCRGLLLDARQFLTVVRQRVTVLGKNNSYSNFASIRVDLEWSVKVGVCHYRS